MWSQWINGLLGIWVVIASWSFMAPSTGRTLLIITGIVVAVLGFWGGAVSPERKHEHHGRV